MGSTNVGKILLFVAVCYCVLISIASCENKTTVQEEDQQDFAQELVEQGRSFFHRHLKRFMILAPAIFFKLGIAFTLLLLVTFVASTNGFIGFLILVVGLSSVLARLQGSAAPLVHPVPISVAPVHAPIHAPVHAPPIHASPIHIAPIHASPIHTLPHLEHHHHHPWIDRSDSVDAVQKPKRSGFVGSSSYDPNSDLRNTGAYFTSGKVV